MRFVGLIVRTILTGTGMQKEKDILGSPNFKFGEPECKIAVE
jgi:hypothetical protein